MTESAAISYLEMRNPNEFLLKPCRDLDFTIKEAEIKQWQINKCFYC